MPTGACGAAWICSVNCWGLTSRVGQHQARNVNSNPSQAGESATSQDAELRQSNNTQTTGQLWYIRSHLRPSNGAGQHGELHKFIHYHLHT